MKTNRGELPANQAKRNAENAVRCLKMITGHDNEILIDRALALLDQENYGDALRIARHIDPSYQQHLCPHPLIVAIAEIKNAIMYSK